MAASKPAAKRPHLKKAVQSKIGAKKPQSKCTK